MSNLEDYDTYDTCAICCSDVEISNIRKEDYLIVEVSMSCPHCKFEDLWSYGRLQSGAYDLSNIQLKYKLGQLLKLGKDEKDGCTRIS